MDEVGHLERQRRSTVELGGRYLSRAVEQLRSFSVTHPNAAVDSTAAECQLAVLSSIVEGGGGESPRQEEVSDPRGREPANVVLGQESVIEAEAKEGDVHASYKDGVLEVRVPCAPVIEETPTRIPVARS